MGYSSPLTLDLSGQGLGTTNQKINYNIDGSDASISNDTAGEGTLTLGSGSSFAQMFGNYTNLSQYGGQDGYKDGYAALQALANIAQSKGQFTSTESADLKKGTLDTGALDVLEKDYGLGIKVGSLDNAPESLAQAGVASINLTDPNTAGTFNNNFDGHGNELETKQGASFTRTNGTTGDYADIWYQTKPQTTV